MINEDCIYTHKSDSYFFLKKKKAISLYLINTNTSLFSYRTRNGYNLLLNINIYFKLYLIIPIYTLNEAPKGVSGINIEEDQSLIRN